MIDKMPSALPKPKKLDKLKKVGELCLGDDFWELETSFKCQERWALDPVIREAITAMHTNRRAREEISLLNSEARRYYDWLTSKLDSCERLLSCIDVESAIGCEVLRAGVKHGDALLCLRGLAEVNLGSEEGVNSNTECKIHASQQSPLTQGISESAMNG